MKKLILISFFFITSLMAQDVIFVDHMDFHYRNALGGRNDIYYFLPSRATFAKGEGIGINGTPGLKLIYEKRNSGGQYNGGICGYISSLHTNRGYLDFTGFNYISFWLKGEKGGENFNIGISDKDLLSEGKTYRTRAIRGYLKNKKITTKWKRVVIPLSYFKINWSEIETITFNFDSYVFDNGEGEGAVFIDDIAFYSEFPKDLEVQREHQYLP